MESSRQFCKGVINEYNSCRTNPVKYVEILENIKKYFKGKVMNVPGEDFGIKTKEGVYAYDDAIEFLKKQKPKCELVENHGLNSIASDIVIGVKTKNTINDNLDAVFSKHGTYSGLISRTVDYGSKDPQMVFTNLLVCDGDLTRGQRKTIFSSELKEIGVATGNEKEYGKVTVITLATKFIPKRSRSIYFTDKKKDSNSKNKNSNTKNLSRFKSFSKPRPKLPSNCVGDEIPPGVKSIEKEEKVIVENGKKKKVTKIIKNMEDGTIKTEINKEDI